MTPGRKRVVAKIAAILDRKAVLFSESIAEEIYDEVVLKEVEKFKERIVELEIENEDLKPALGFGDRP